ncbi:PREDICTED: ADP-ribosyl cyclase/cyclic ADP-ribose hydrolase 1 [Crocodylus porosus]|uniref:ADP-ribosyl cyclase/cyclic ADP-ribose hydrolase 1 n=1 Tax=Crocodylus porosus TaxID=8502 RepID=A0A7M4E8G0_CROPO|nr:PREDICTED: ADP-ribosyl cyclase/cyclic ADP-ribose hydrolase 1 [Crocodylus porosus]
MLSQNSSFRTWHRTVLLVGVLVLLVSLVVVIVLAVILTPGKEDISSTLPQWKGRGTTKNLQEVVLGRCYNYITTVNPELGNKDCLKIWETLQDAFMYKNPCNITTDDYQPLMDLARHPVPCNKSLFWSKTNELVHRYTKADDNFLTLEDTLLGYIADQVSWCGDPASPGINYESCPKWTECESNPSTVYWKMASKMFAEEACGVVQVMLNGSIDAGAFRSSSIFGSVEIFNLDPNKVSTIQIWLMHNIGGPKRDSCTGYSITRLKSILEERNFTVSCEDNYRPVWLFQCASEPGHEDCRLCLCGVQ